MKVVPSLALIQRVDAFGQRHELVFPMTAGASGPPPSTRTSSAPPSTRSASGVHLRVEIDAGVPITDLASPSHALQVTRSGRRATVELASADAIANRDFVLRYEVGGAAREVGLLAHRDGGTGSFLLIAQPPAIAEPALVTPRELVLVLDAQTAVAGGIVFAAHRSDGGHQLSAFRVDTGAWLWSRWVGSELLAAPVAGDGAVFASTLGGWTFAFGARDGTPLWRKPLQATTAPWPDGDELFVTRRSAGKEQQIVVAAATGDVLREHGASHGAYAWDVPGAGSDPQAVWAFEGSRPVAVRGVRYVAMGGEVRDTRADSGESVWLRRYADAPETRSLGSVALAGAQLVVAARDGTLFGLDIDTGATLWSYAIGHRVTAEPVIARGWVYAATEDGYVVALEVGDATLDGWHMFGGSAAHAGPVEVRRAAAPVRM